MQKTEEKSPDWDSLVNQIKRTGAKRLQGFPFNVSFPKTYIGQKYEVITVNADIIKATVDDSREFCSEGLEWKTAEGNKPQAVIAAWRKL